jgi:hypothetical protein
MASASSLKVYRCAQVFAGLFCLMHMISLPVAISYDGHIYIEMASVLGSSRFPADWNVARTPLFPLALKGAFWALGRQPLAVIGVSSVLGLSATLILGYIARRIAGEIVAALVMVVLALFPTFVAYQHFALTEAGTSFFLILLAAALLLPANRPWQLWMKTGLVVVTLVAGFYWRQALLQLAPVAGVLYVPGAWLYAQRLFPGKFIWGKLSRGTAIILAQAILIGVIPYVAAKPWARYTNEPGMRDVTLRQGMLRQALLPPEDSYTGPIRDEYMAALRESLFRGNMYSGLRPDLLGKVSGEIYVRPMDTSVPAFYLNLIRRYPGRYAAGVGRTLILFSGVNGLVSENRNSREMVLSATSTGAKLGDGPTEIQGAIKADFQQITKASVVLRFLRALFPFYDVLIIIANIVTLAGLATGIARRDIRAIVLCGVPVVYMVFCALVLASIDRYAFPAYPMVLADSILVPVIWVQAIRSRIVPSPVPLAAKLSIPTKQIG